MILLHTQAVIRRLHSFLCKKKIIAADKVGVTYSDTSCFFNSGSSGWGNFLPEGAGFWRANYVVLDETFALNWKGKPACMTAREIIQAHLLLSSRKIPLAFILQLIQNPIFIEWQYNHA